ncbi:hypothetical protein AV540_06425 [Brevibacillus parabrevis]|uniref:hypothetical protein n=1 Tax=Brevibacillus parabrevis TaxID=54914 RepID=UPI0007AB3850|nr:hypothetical protein [Brevibacillus parabrevis]KZE54661.1 hypothetical protein AV540_06425 [Brevibacillus parabrevis]
MVFWALLLACSAQNRGEWWIDREDNVRALWLFGSFFMFYLAMNIPFLTYTQENAAFHWAIVS